MALIELENVEVHYGRLKALDRVSCSVEGGAVGLLGPNGAGKSTLMKTLLGYNRASTGTVRVFGFDMPKRALEVRQRLGYMPEREVVSPKVSAVSFLTYCGQLFGMSRIDAMERSHEVLNYVGMGDSRYRRMDTYSTGMLQRTKLAQALVHDPKLLLLDEPTNGLDPDSRIEMLELIKDIAQHRQVTVLLSSHLLPDVQHVCDRVIIVHKGRIMEQGTIAELTTQYERHFEVRVRENKEQYLAALVEHGFQYTERQNGDLLVMQPEQTSPRAIFEIAQSLNTQVRHFRPARHTLAEVFVDAMGND
jgi:ABC-2 type transport system ATP-binding protein